MAQVNQNFRKAKRRLSRKHNRLFAFQKPAHGVGPPAADHRRFTSAQIMRAAESTFLTGPAQITIRMARRMCGYVHKGPSRWWPHQNTREMQRRQHQTMLFGDAA
jgi:hypothetical protein